MLLKICKTKSDVGSPQLLTFLTEFYSKVAEILRRIETIAKWCCLIFVHHKVILEYMHNDFKTKWKKNNNDMNLKPVLKASLAEIGRELKQDAYQISMC